MAYWPQCEDRDSGPSPWELTFLPWGVKFIFRASLQYMSRRNLSQPILDFEDSPPVRQTPMEIFHLEGERMGNPLTSMEGGLSGNHGSHASSWEHAPSWPPSQATWEVWVYLTGVPNKILFGSIFLGFQM